MTILCGCHIQSFEREVVQFLSLVEKRSQIQLYKFILIENIQKSHRAFFEHYIFILCSIQTQLDLKRILFSYFISQVQFEVRSLQHQKLTQCGQISIIGSYRRKLINSHYYSSYGRIFSDNQTLYTPVSPKQYAIWLVENYFVFRDVFPGQIQSFINRQKQRTSKDFRKF
ncbi:Hypothetical_protein [Hexamita inflata]|uniref:Hypothetical_protein n=1 Tax=Hexamita inflata TaxID=28002 RepID=A0AA86R2Y3_9EUKA|nr:Hypothetical protein HINF_LOCUS58354 [Hexamita inflata]